MKRVVTFIKVAYMVLMSLRDQYKFNVFPFFRDFVSFLKDYKNYKKQKENLNFILSTKYIYPCLRDKTLYTPVEPTYFFQDTWAAGKINEIKPLHHYDVGSSVKTIGIISQFVPVTMIDIRPVDLELNNLYFKHGSILNLPFEDNGIENLSSLCVVEHIGLGRYGEPIDPWGSEKAIKELNSVLKLGGNLLFLVPIDEVCRVYFNAHRVFTKEYILDLFKDMKLIQERYIYGRAVQDFYEKSKDFGTGLFHFRKGES